jgi:hypothetical protein
LLRVIGNNWLKLAKIFYPLPGNRRENAQFKGRGKQRVARKGGVVLQKSFCEQQVLVVDSQTVNNQHDS